MRFLELAVKPIGQHSELNPRIWQRGSVRPEVKRALLELAKEFIEFIDVPFEIQDIIIAGAQANLTYTAHSDLDLHLVVDYDTVRCDQEVAELFDSKRLLWREMHSVKIRGIPVEPGVENAQKPTVSAAYSLLSDRWIRQPRTEPVDYAKDQVADLVQTWQRLISRALNSQRLEFLQQTLGLLRTSRKAALATAQGEFHPLNLAYKSLRNRGTVEQLQTTINRIKDRNLSITEQW
jgi:hypothetical protein